MLANLINNIAFLIALVAAGQIVMSHAYRRPVNRHVVLGWVFGGVALLGMTNPVNFLPGVIFDGRTIVLAVAGVVGGGVTAAIAAGIAVLYRLSLGGAGVWVGMSVAVLSALLGVLARQWWQRRSDLPRWLDFFALGVVVQLMQLAAFTQIPNRAGYAFIEQAWWVLLLFYPLATMLLCLMFRNFEQQQLDKASAQKANQARIAEETANLKRFHAYFDQSIVGLAITSPDKGWIEVNDALCTTLGYSRDELTRMTWSQVTHPEDLEQDVFQFQRMLSGEIDNYAMDKRFLHKDGHVVYTRLAVSHVRTPDNRLDYVLAMVEDITERKLAEQALATERAHLKTLIGSIPDLIWLKDAQGRYISCNPEFERFFGATESAIVGKTDHDFVPAELADAFRAHDLKAMEAGQPSRNEEWITYATDGRQVLLETTKVPIQTNEGRLIGVLGIGHDITERKAHQQQLEHLAHFDPLTGLANRVLMADRLQQALAQTLRRKTTLAIAYLDLDGFKAINDRFGHATGDRLLKALSGQMKHALREVDTLARLGGDEFVAIFLDLPNVESSLPMLSRLLAAAAEVVRIDEVDLKVSASLGVTYFPQAEAIDADQLLRQADQAMYQAKQMGKNRYHIFDAEHDRSVRGHHEEQERIKQALHQQEFVLHYQPKVNMRTGEVVGLEALIRWQHPQRGLLPPSAFLPMVANHPLAIELGQWVLQTAVAQIEAWKAAGMLLQVSVNIDAIHLEQPDFVDQLRALLTVHPLIHPGDLEFEVLETSALDDTARVSGVMQACRTLGVGFALDDFGTGYSSLTYLKHLPAGLLKIDQSFVRDMLDDSDDLSILEGILGLSKAFQRRVIAEGVETKVHGEMLLRLGCDWAQGYAIARPMPAPAVLCWCAEWRPDPSWSNLTPINRDDLPILIAWVEHRAWSQQVLCFVEGTCPEPPVLDHELCCVGQWVAAERRVHGAHPAAMAALEQLHLEVHVLASELIRLKRTGQQDEAFLRIVELQGLRDRLLEMLVHLIDENPH
jgi:diguanylate cyclase (GGDEF)-like protein/PAS domain S-box-containing protein